MLPAGLAFHCDACHVVIPADAPHPEGGDCAILAANRMTPFKPEESIAGQFTMAAAAWGLIYHAPLKADAHAESSAYHHGFRMQRKDHFAASALRAAMTPDQVRADAKMFRGRDAWLYEEKK